MTDLTAESDRLLTTLWGMLPSHSDEYRDLEFLRASLLAIEAAVRATAEADRARLAEALEAIRDYSPTEVVYDEFAYQRMVDSYRDAASRALARPGAAEVERCGFDGCGRFADSGVHRFDKNCEHEHRDDCHPFQPAPVPPALTVEGVPALESLSSTGQAPGVCAWRLAPAPPCGHPASHPFHIACSLGTGFHDSNACHGYVDA